MKLKTLYATPVWLYCLLFSTFTHAQLQKIYLHPKTVAREKQSKYVDSVRFIPLEVKDGLELSAYYNVQVTEKYFLLVDYINKRLVLYSTEGRLIKEISYKKLGGDFYPAYKERTNKIVFFGKNKNYVLTPKDEIKIKLDWANPRNRKYYKKYEIDLNDSTLSIKKATPDEKDIIGIYPYYEDYYLQERITTSPLYKDSLDYELKLYNNNQLVKSFFPYNRVNEPRFLYTEEYVSSSKMNTDTRILTRPFCDTIYKLVKDSLFPIYQVVLPLENSLSASFFTTPFKGKTERNNFDRNNGWMLHQISSFYETQKLILFSIRYLSNYESYIYEKATDLTYKTQNMKADSSQYNIGLLSNYGTERRGDWFYKPLRASDILPYFEKNKNVSAPKDLEVFVNSKPPATTPVIVVFKLKN